MESVLDSLKENNVYHPLIVVLGWRKEIHQVFVTVEQNAIPVSLGLVSAVDKLLKLHFILNMQYAAESHHILHFLQRCIMNVPEQLSLSREAADLAVYIRNKKRKRSEIFVC